MTEGAGKVQLWTAPFILLSVSNLATMMGFYLFLPTMATYAVNSLDASPAEAGLAASIFFIGAVTARLFAGALIQKWGSGRNAIIWLAAGLVTTVGYPFASTLELVLAVRFAHGFAFGVASTAVMAAVMQIIPPSRRGEGAGWATAGMAIATGLAPVLALSLLNGPGMQVVFLSAIVFAAIALASVLIVARRLPGRIPPAHDQPEAPRGLLHRFIEVRALSIGVVMMTAGIAYSSVATFMNNFTVDRGMLNMAGIYFLVYAAATLVVRIGAGRIQDRFGPDRLMVPILTFIALGVLLTAWSPNVPVLLLGAVILGLGYGCMPSVGQSIAVGRAGLPRSGVAVATYYLFVDLGTGLGPVILGAVVPSLGFEGAFVIGTLVVMVGIALWWLWGRRGKSAELVQ